MKDTKITKSWKCQYSDSCFTCPMPDCSVDQNMATRVNKMEWDVFGMRAKKEGCENGNQKN